MCIKFKDTYDEPFAEFDEQEKRDALGKGLAEFNKKMLVFCIIGVYAIKIGHKSSFSRIKNFKKIFKNHVLLVDFFEMNML